jgi:2-iminobutanoate/2-iminopropanoate deaminase
MTQAIGQPRKTLAALALLIALSTTTACAQTPAVPFKKESANYSEWAKGKFSEVVTVTNAQRTLYLAGVGSEDENAVGAAKILYPESFYQQCKYAWDKIRRILEKQGAGLGDIAKVTTYVTDIRNIQDGFRCRGEVFGTMPQPAGTLVQVTGLAWPGMMIEVDVTAVTGH